MVAAKITLTTQHGSVPATKGAPHAYLPRDHRTPSQQRPAGVPRNRGRRKRAPAVAGHQLVLLWGPAGERTSAPAGSLFRRRPHIFLPRKRVLRMTSSLQPATHVATVNGRDWPASLRDDGMLIDLRLFEPD